MIPAFGVEVNKLLNHPSTRRLERGEFDRLIAKRDALEKKLWVAVAPLWKSVWVQAEILKIEYVQLRNRLKRAKPQTDPQKFYKFMVKQDMGRSFQHQLMAVVTASGKHKQLVACWKELDTLRQTIALRNLRLVMTIVNKYVHRVQSLTNLDLLQEGYFGLIAAVERFEAARKLQFSTYAIWWIRHTVRRALDEKDETVRIPVHQLDLKIRFRKQRAKIAQKTGVAPSDMEVMTALVGRKGASRRLSSYHQSLLTYTSVDAPLSNDNGEENRTVGDLIPDEEPTIIEDMSRERVSQLLTSMMSRLTENEFYILNSRFGLNGEEKTLKEIGDEFGLSRERVRQLQERALVKLRHWVKRPKFSGIMDARERAAG